MKQSVFRWSTALLSFVVAGCLQPAPSSSGEQADGGTDAATSAATERRTQANEHDQRDHWIGAGEGSRTDRIAADGTPVRETGRFVNGGEGTDAGAVNSSGWLVGSASGWVQLLDEDGTSVGESREAFSNGTLNTVIAGSGDWLVGGSAGRVHRVDQNGQPKGSARQVLSASAGITAGAFGSSGWLVGDDEGRLVRLHPTNLQPQSSEFQLSGSASVVEVVRANNGWYVFTERDYAEVTSQGPENRKTLATNRAITAAAADGSTVAVGADDGRVLVAQVSNLSSATWENALDGEAVRALATDGQEWLAAGTSGVVRKLDASGAPQGSVQTLAAGFDLSGARSRSNGWWVTYARMSVIQSIDDSLSPGDRGPDVLRGADIREVVASSDRLLAVGGQGRYRLLGSDGSPAEPVESLGNFGSLRGAEWNGSQFMVAGDAGKIALLAPDGSVDTRAERLGGSDIATVSWSGENWLIVSDSGEAQRLRTGGQTYEGPITTELDSVTYAEFNGDQWIIVGAKENKGAFVLLRPDGTMHEPVKKLDPVDGTLLSADYNGLEWLVGGSGGTVVRIDHGGDVIRQGQSPGVRNALYGHPVHAIEYNGTEYLIGGGFGAVRRLEFDALPAGAASVSNGFETVRTLEWADARGYPGGPCVSSEFCFNGPCIGGSSNDAFCCESECPGACKSCYGDVTGEEDGLCAPVPEGDEPPNRSDDDCVRSSKSSCGLNGTCDGEGECAFWGTDVQCSDPVCEDGVRSGEGFCDGAGDCVVDEQTSCEPYADCIEGERTCASSCEDGGDCVEGYVCVEGECIDPDEQMTPDAGNGSDTGMEDDGSGGSESGCSTTGGGVPVVGGWIAVLGAALLGRRRRRRGRKR